jgi:hypothetical protein
MNLFFIFRILTGTGVIGSVYSHQLHFVLSGFGANLVTIPYLLCALLFYIYILIDRFITGGNNRQTFLHQEKKVLQIRMIMLGINLLLCIQENISRTKNLDVQTVIYLVLLNIFVAFPDIFLDFFLRLFKRNSK